MREYAAQVERHIDMFCRKVKDRSTGSPGNKRAALYIAEELSDSGCTVKVRKLRAMDWNSRGAWLKCGELTLKVFPSQYSEGCRVNAVLLPVSTVSELKKADAKGKVLLLHGELASEQLMPKNFVFYNPESSRLIVSLLEKSGAAALACATGRNAALAGGAYPFPLIEDGDFNVPSVYMTDRQGRRLLGCRGKKVELISRCSRKITKALSVLAEKKGISGKKIVISAHMDAKKGSPGAIDNATGAAILLLTARLLRGAKLYHTAEFAPFNGEDYFAVPGQMDYIRLNKGRFSNIIMNINIDGAAYKRGDTALSFYGVGNELKKDILGAARKMHGIAQGREWQQGDHSIFVQMGVPAIAVTSAWFSDNISSQKITHTEKDRPAIISAKKAADIAVFLAGLIMKIAGGKNDIK